MKKQRILFLVHVEESFRQYFPDEAYAARLVRATRIYDHVICLVSHVLDEKPIQELHWRTENWEWGWGYEKDMFERKERKWIIPTYSPHEFTWVHPELRDPKKWENFEILVGGGCRNECLQDFIDVLNYVGIKHRVIDGYVF